MKKYLFLGMVLGAGIFGLPWVLAQPVVFTGPWTGAETFTITLGSGTGVQINLAQVRNASNIATTTTATGTVTATNLVGTTIFTAALSGAVTFQTPLNPYDGTYYTIGNGTGSAFTQTITFTANPAATPAQTVNGGAAATMAANSSAAWQFNAANNTWYRVR